MKTIACTLFYLLMTYGGYAQQSTLGTRGYNQFHTAPRGFITTFAPAPKEKPTSIYLYDEWRTGQIFLKDSTQLDNLYIKIDLKTSSLEIQHNNDIKILPFSRLLAVAFPIGIGQEEVYVNGLTVFGPSSPFKDQLVEALREDEVSLYAKNVAHIIEAKPNEALALSSSLEENKIVIKKKYIITYHNQTIEVDNKGELREELITLFGTDAAPLIKKVNLRREEDVVELVTRLNDLAQDTEATK